MREGLWWRNEWKEPVDVAQGHIHQCFDIMRHGGFSKAWRWQGVPAGLIDAVVRVCTSPYGKAKIMVVDTFHLFPETMEFLKEIEEFYGFKAEVFCAEGVPVGDKAGYDKKCEYLKTCVCGKNILKFTFIAKFN